MKKELTNTNECFIVYIDKNICSEQMVKKRRKRSKNQNGKRRKIKGIRCRTFADRKTIWKRRDDSTEGAGSEGVPLEDVLPEEEDILN